MAMRSRASRPPIMRVSSWCLNLIFTQMDHLLFNIDSVARLRR